MKSVQTKERVIENTRRNRDWFDRLGDEGGEKLIKHLEARFDPRSMLRRGKDGSIDPLAMAAKCGAYEVMSYLKQCIDMGSRNE